MPESENPAMSDMVLLPNLSARPIIQDPSSKGRRVIEARDLGLEYQSPFTACGWMPLYRSEVRAVVDVTRIRS